MRLWDLIESTTELAPMHKNAQKKITRMRDVGGLDRNYHLNRIMMAAAMADGVSTKAVNSPADTWAEKYNTAHPYTDQEHKMIQAAMNTVPTNGNLVSGDGKSKEADDVHTISPVPHNSGRIRKKRA